MTEIDDARIISMIDLTSLNEDYTEETVLTLCDKAITPKGNVAAVCIMPAFVALAHERLEGTGVKVQALCPGNIPTGFQQVAGTERVAFTRTPSMPAATVAEVSLRALDRGQLLVIPGLRDRIMVALQRVVPRPVVRRAAAGLFRPAAKG